MGAGSAFVQSIPAHLSLVQQLPTSKLQPCLAHPIHTRQRKRTSNTAILLSNPLVDGVHQAQFESVVSVRCCDFRKRAGRPWLCRRISSPFSSHFAGERPKAYSASRCRSNTHDSA